ncbi:MAG: hypothetical protein HRU25_11585 [Psychrobium sp.]|nr:hypothetical protein [Psychrobium sp.]
MQTFNKSLISSVLSIALVGCGGSSGGSTDGDSGGSGGGGSNTEYNFAFSASVTNKCGVKQPLANIEFFVQDKDWNYVATHISDADGKVAFTTKDQFINYTVVTKKSENGSLSDVKLTSFAQVKSGSMVSFMLDDSSAADNTSCECITQDVQLNHPRIDSIKSTFTSASNTGSKVLSPFQTLFKGVEVCRVQDGEWPVHSFMVEGPSGTRLLTGWTGFMTDYVANDESLWSLNGLEASISQTVDHNDYDTLVTGQLFDQRVHFKTEAALNDTEITFFDNHQYTQNSRYMGIASNIHQESTSIFGRLTFSSEQIVYSTQYDDVIDLTPEHNKPDIDMLGLTDIQKDGEYDFSAVSGYPLVIFTSELRTHDPKTGQAYSTTWKVYGPNKGKLPVKSELPGYEHLIKDDVSIKSSEMLFLSSDIANDYAAFIGAVAIGQEHQVTGPFSHYRTHYVGLKIN